MSQRNILSINLGIGDGQNVQHKSRLNVQGSQCHRDKMLQWTFWLGQNVTVVVVNLDVSSRHREIAGSPLGSPQQPTMLVVKLEGGPPASVRPGQKSCVRSSGIITQSAPGPRDRSGQSLPQTRPQWSITSGSPMYRDNANRRILVPHKYPLGIEPGSLMMGSKQVDHWTSGTVYESSEIAGTTQYMHSHLNMYYFWACTVFQHVI